MILSHASLSAQVEPDWGGALVRFDCAVDGVAQPLLRAWRPGPDTAAAPPDPNQLACYPLLPWSNRISHGGFAADGRRIELPRNRSDEPWPIHGSGWQRPWRVEDRGDDYALLSLQEYARDGYCYRASLQYLLGADALDVRLGIANTGLWTLPFGLGLHPFFPRDADTRLYAPAREVWLNDGRTPLPRQLASVPEGWRFGGLRPLPADCVDHCFAGWSGEASIRWPRRRLRLELRADVDRFVLYTPQDADFFCFEPVDHAIDAVNLPGGASAHGMSLLAPGQSLHRQFRFSVHRDAG